MLVIEHKLRELGVAFRLIELNEKVVSVSDVAQLAAGTIRVEEICKTLLVKGKTSGNFFALVVRGADRIDFKKVAAVLHEKAEMASAEEVVLETGVVPGAVCPFLLSVPLYIDEKVFHLEQINTGSGDLYHGIEFASSALCTVMTASVDIAK